MFINFLKGSLGIFVAYLMVWLFSALFLLGSFLFIIYLLLG